ncbi:MULTISPECIES: hydantoinase/oxoprolinase family protein [Methylobacterium]|uniref:5-oxoprolinase n=2 Tax=Methylobacterium TaxID=407 RepID=A0A0C6FDE4_9HYPH|nr:hydantoinase/oxoprolinase family protein [Methylobacterium aquaticum]BAQ44842.1 5-oxoprolinase [Methylobacterium aquaticum]
MAAARLRVASDVGGTFTDSIAYDEASRRISVSKVPTTPGNRALGTVAGLKRAVAAQGLSGAEIAYVGHGMTTATNAVIQRKGGRTAFVTNRGFRDLLLIGRQDRPSLFDVDDVRPPPLVPQELCYTAAGRIDAAGREIEPLSLADLEAAAADMRARGVEAVAVTFLHSYANPAHERAAKALLERLLPGVPVCASTEIVAEFREFERASTAVLNAYLRPIMETYLGSLAGLLGDREDGLGLPETSPVMVIEASGGLMTLDSAREKPVHTVLSGPAGGVVGSAHVAGLAGIRDIVTMDIGGTSTDISLIREGKPILTRQARLETVPIRLPVIDINAIGAGGGSIAWIDDGGALRVGPMSAEAVPGPAAYGRGGTRPTVTDANLVLGRFGADTRLGGDLTLDLAAARAAVATIAAPLGLDVVAAAAGILRVAHATIVRGIRVVSVERGLDPRDFALVPFGGAGPMHGTPVARDLAIPRLLVPPTPGILCALGQLVSDLRHDLVETHVGAHADFAAGRAAGIVAALTARGDALLAADTVPPDRRTVSAFVDMRYVGQSYELPIALPARLDEVDWAGVPARFHDAHRARFGHADASAPVECVSFGVTAVGRIDTPVLPVLEEGGAAPPPEARTGSRPVYFEALSRTDIPGFHDAPVFARAALRAGNVVEGPAVIEEVSATTILYPGDRAVADASGSLIVEMPA